MSKFLYPIYKLNIESYKKWWLYHKKAGGSGVLSEILEGFSFNLENTLNRKFNLFEIEGNSEQESTTGKNIAYVTNTVGDKIAFDNSQIITYSSGATASNFVNLEQNTLEANQEYIFEMFLTSTTQNTAQTELVLRDINNTALFDIYKTINNSSLYYSYNFTPTADTTLYRLQLYNNTATPLTGDVKFKLQIRKANTTGGYEPYTGGQAAPNPSYPQEIHSTGDSGSVNEKVSNSDGTQEQNISFPLAQGQKLMQGDYLADDGVHHVRGEIILDGTENITIGTGGASEPTNKYFDIIKTTNIAKNNITLKCTHFIQRTIWGVDQIGINYEGAANSKSVRIRANFSTIEDFKSWLAEQYANGTPVKVQYKLAEEVIDPYTEEQQAVWEQIKALRTYKPVTHISSTDETPAYLKIQYYKER